MIYNRFVVRKDSDKMYGKKSEKIAEKIRLLERQSKQDTAEYKALLSKYTDVRRKETEAVKRNLIKNNERKRREIR